MAFLSFIGDFFAKLFNSAKRVWKKLDDDVKIALLKGSSIVAVINDNVEATPAFVWEIIQKKLPDITEEKAKDMIAKGAAGLSIASEINDADLMTMIERLQKFLDGLQGSVWAKISHTLALGIAVVEAPIGTKFSALSALADYVYHDLVKGK